MRRIPKRKLSSQRLSLRSQTALENAAHVLTRMREGYSLTSASTEYGVDRRTVEKLAEKALHKTESGRYAVRVSDNLPRILVVPIEGELKEVRVRGSRAASQLAARLSAQREFLATGNDAKIRTLQREKVYDASGREIPFLTELDELERLGDAGILSFESIYARRA